MKIEYYICNPTGNITALVAGERDASVAERIMSENPSVEQVGFVTDGGKTLTMAGGEFCGNASMSAGALYCKNTGEKKVSLCVSGADEPVCVTVSDASAEKNGKTVFSCTVKMPGKASVSEEKLSCPDGGEITVPVVRMPGICHAVLEGDAADMAEAEETAKLWCRQLASPALGIMFFNESKSFMTPLVYVPCANTLFWESSCASGTSALGAYLAKKQNSPVEKEIFEPAGSLCVSATPDGEVSLSGSVAIENACDLQA